LVLTSCLVNLFGFGFGFGSGSGPAAALNHSLRAFPHARADIFVVMQSNCRQEKMLLHDSPDFPAKPQALVALYHDLRRQLRASRRIALTWVLDWHLSLLQLLIPGLELDFTVIL